MRSSHSRAGPILEAEIADGAVTEAKLGAGAVTTAKIAANAVTSAEIAAGAVNTPQIATDAIGAGKIQAGAVGNVKLSGNSIRGNVVFSTTTTAAGSSIAAGGSVELTLAAYSFFPMVHGTNVGGSGWLMAGHGTDGASADAARFRLYNGGTDFASYDMDYRAMQAS